MSKKHPPALPRYSRLLLAILCLYLFVVGLSISLSVIEDWCQRPDYITDSSSSFFAGGLFLAPGLLLLIIPRANPARGKISLLLALLAAAWSIFIICLRIATIADYKDDTRFGVCVQYGRNHSEMYVWNSDWCEHFGRRIKYLSPAASQEPQQ